MRRTYVLGVIVMTGALAAAAAQLGARHRPDRRLVRRPLRVSRQRRVAAPGGGRGPAARPLGDREGREQSVHDSGQGGNTAVFITAKGVVLVDTKNPNNGQGILDQVKTVTDKPITHIINTHTHADHTGSNAFFPATVEIVTHENTAANMAEDEELRRGDATKHGLPDRTYKDKLTVLDGNDAIDLYYFGPAHTNGDTFVVFRNLRLMHPGDAFAHEGAGVHRCR